MCIAVLHFIFTFLFLVPVREALVFETRFSLVRGTFCHSEGFPEPWIPVDRVDACVAAKAQAGSCVSSRQT